MHMVKKILTADHSANMGCCPDSRGSAVLLHELCRQFRVVAAQCGDTLRHFALDRSFLGNSAVWSNCCFNSPNSDGEKAKIRRTIGFKNCSFVPSLLLLHFCFLLLSIVLYMILAHCSGMFFGICSFYSSYSPILSYSICSFYMSMSFMLFVLKVFFLSFSLSLMVFLRLFLSFLFVVFSLSVNIFHDALLNHNIYYSY